MAELLQDNMELGRRQSLEAGLGGGARPSRREVPDLLSWIACFGMYASVVAQKHPHRTRAVGISDVGGPSELMPQVFDGVHVG